MRKWSLFEDLPSPALEKFALLLVERTYNKGDMLVRQGTPLQRLIFIKEGECILTTQVYVPPPWKRKESPQSMANTCPAQRHILRVRPIQQPREFGSAILSRNTVIGDVDFVAGRTTCEQSCIARSEKLHTYELDLALQNGAAQVRYIECRPIISTRDSILPYVSWFLIAEPQAEVPAHDGG
jgi:hypothetical protein